MEIHSGRHRLAVCLSALIAGSSLACGGEDSQPRRPRPSADRPSPGIGTADTGSPQTSTPRIDVVIAALHVPDRVRREQQFAVRIEVSNSSRSLSAGTFSIELRAGLRHPGGATNVPLGTFASAVLRRARPEWKRRESERRTDRVDGQSPRPSARSTSKTP